MTLPSGSGTVVQMQYMHSESMSGVYWCCRLQNMGVPWARAKNRVLGKKLRAAKKTTCSRSTINYVEKIAGREADPILPGFAGHVVFSFMGRAPMSVCPRISGPYRTRTPRLSTLQMHFVDCGRNDRATV